MDDVVLIMLYNYELCVGRLSSLDFSRAFESVRRRDGRQYLNTHKTDYVRFLNGHPEYWRNYRNHKYKTNNNGKIYFCDLYILLPVAARIFGRSNLLFYS